MNNDIKMIIVILICGLCTFVIRDIPFLIFGGKKKLPAIVEYLGVVSPPAVIAILVVYCFKTIGTDVNNLELILAGIATVIVHIAFKNTLLSVFLGTVCYMVLLR